MKETCTLIKNSELEELRSVVSNYESLIKDEVDSKTEYFRNRISEMDKEIVSLKKTIVDMNNNPQIDPLKMVITVERQVDSGKYDKYGDKIKTTRIYRENIIEPINFDLSGKLQKQIQNIIDIFTRRDRTNMLNEIDVAASEKFLKWKRESEDNIILNFAEEGYFERKKIVKKINDKKNGTCEFK